MQLLGKKSFFLLKKKLWNNFVLLYLVVGNLGKSSFMSFSNLILNPNKVFISYNKKMILQKRCCNFKLNLEYINFQYQSQILVLLFSRFEIQFKIQVKKTLLFDIQCLLNDRRISDSKNQKLSCILVSCFNVDFCWIFKVCVKLFAMKWYTTNFHF